MGTPPARSTIDATYVEPSADTILPIGSRIGDLYNGNMSQPYVLQRLSERAWRVQSFNYGTVFYVGDSGVLLFDTLEGVYDNIVQAVSSVTDKPITAVIYPQYHVDHIGDAGKYVDEAKRDSIDLRIIASSKTNKVMDPSNSGFPSPTEVVEWSQGNFNFEGLTVDLHGFEFAGNERFHFHEDNLKQVYDLEWDSLSGSHGNVDGREDIDIELSHVAELKTAVGQTIGTYPVQRFC